MASPELPSIYRDYGNKLNEVYMRVDPSPANTPPRISDREVAYEVGHKVNALLGDAQEHYDETMAAMDKADDPLHIFAYAQQARKEDIQSAVYRGELMHKKLAPEDFNKGQRFARSIPLDPKFMQDVERDSDRRKTAAMEGQFADPNQQITGLVIRPKDEQ